MLPELTRTTIPAIPNQLAAPLSQSFLAKINFYPKVEGRDAWEFCSKIHRREGGGELESIHTWLLYIGVIK